MKAIEACLFKIEFNIKYLLTNSYEEGNRHTYMKLFKIRNMLLLHMIQSKIEKFFSCTVRQNPYQYRGLHSDVAEESWMGKTY